MAALYPLPNSSTYVLSPVLYNVAIFKERVSEEITEVIRVGLTPVWLGP